jgi:membrane peptidoglycan carboxypeptidase
MADTPTPLGRANRRNIVIAALRQQGSINATAAPLGMVRDQQAPAAGCAGAGDAGFFCAYAEQYLEQAGLSADQLSTGGVTVRTTLLATAGFSSAATPALASRPTTAATRPFRSGSPNWSASPAPAGRSKTFQGGKGLTGLDEHHVRRWTPRESPGQM